MSYCFQHDAQSNQRLPANAKTGVYLHFEVQRPGTAEADC